MAARVAAVTAVAGTALGCALALSRSWLPAIFTTDPALAARIGGLVPLLTLQQPLVACTLLMEGLLVGAAQFRWLGATTLVTTSAGTAAVLALGRLRPDAGVNAVWWGITGAITSIKHAQEVMHCNYSGWGITVFVGEVWVLLNSGL
jgi:Na+-driven multidrug efflux pump